MKNIKVAIAGLGNVGIHVIKNLCENNKYIYKKSEIKFDIIGISAKNKNKKRIFNIDKFKWFENPLDLIDKLEPDILVELIGEEKGISYKLICKALKNKIHVVTANKALIAMHGNDLFSLADNNKVLLLFEAAVAGAIPIINILKSSIYLNKIKKISGILNGTTNFILSQMYNTGENFENVLKDAKNKGFAESNSKNDIEGIDAAHKLTILSTLSFGIKLNFKNVFYKGISNINSQDIKFSKKLGYKIKLVSSSEIINNKINSIVEPTLVKENSKIALIEGVQNGIKIQTDYLSSLFLEGEGAGGKPTSSSIISDLLEIVNNHNSYSLGFLFKNLKETSAINFKEIMSSYYLRINVKDIPGALAKITSKLNENGISIKTILQLPENTTKNAKLNIPIIITTHDTTLKLLDKALNDIEKLDFVLSKIVKISIDKNIV